MSLETAIPTAEPETQPKRRMSWLAILPLILFVGLAGIFFRQLWRGVDPSRLPSPLIGKPAPEFNLPPVDGLLRDGTPVPGLATADFSGKVTVVNLWGSWCIDCRLEHDQLQRLSQDKRIRLVGITWKDQPENARRYLGTLGNPFAAVGVDTTGRAAIDWGLYGVPESFVVGPDGKIVYKFIGPLTDDSLEKVLMPQVEQALKLAAK